MSPFFWSLPTIDPSEAIQCFASIDEKTEAHRGGSAGPHLPVLREQPGGDGRQVEEEVAVALLQEEEE